MKKGNGKSNEIPINRAILEDDFNVLNINLIL